MATRNNHPNAPHTAPHHARPALTDTQIANIIFNETRSLSGGDIAAARTNIAHAIINAHNSPHRVPRMAPATAHVPAAERAAFAQSQAAVQAARRNIAAGVDPTNGATHFNFRSNASNADFQGNPIRTTAGPLNNSNPSHDLPATNIHANTYR